jgi:hypothetical protein
MSGLSGTGSTCAVMVVSGVLLEATLSAVTCCCVYTRVCRSHLGWMSSMSTQLVHWDVRHMKEVEKDMS